MRGPAATQASKSVLKSETRKSEKKNKTRKKQSKQIKRLRVKINGMRKNDKGYEENEMRGNHDKYKAIWQWERRHETLFSSVKAQASLW